MVCGSYKLGNTGLSIPFRSGFRRGQVDGIDVIELAIPYSNADNFLRRTLGFLGFAFRGIRLALMEQYDLIFATSTPLTIGIPGIVARLLRRKPFVFEVRDLWPELPREMGVITNPVVLGLLAVLERVSYRAASGHIGLSPGIVEGIARHLSPSTTVELIPNGCDISFFSPPTSPDPSSPKKDCFTAVFSGAHGIANGLDAALDAAQVLKDRGRRDIQLLFVGDGMLKPRLKNRAANGGLDNCVFQDPIPKRELVSLLHNADVGMQLLANVRAFCYGTSPNKFFDYIACGLPVLNNYPGWLAELIEQHGCGIAVPPENPEAFADALEYMADHPERCYEMGRNARQLAERFDRRKLADRFVDFLEEKARL